MILRTRPGSMGLIEVICGSMFSGKTEELLRRVKRAVIAKQKVQVFKPVIDDRYSKDHVQSHDANRIHSQPVERARDILKYFEKRTNDSTVGFTMLPFS